MSTTSIAALINSLYTEGRWRQYPNYLCTKCPFATLQETDMRQHVLGHIPPPPKVVRPVLVPLLDSTGSQVTEMPIIMPTTPPAPQIPARINPRVSDPAPPKIESR